MTLTLSTTFLSLSIAVMLAIFIVDMRSQMIPDLFTGMLAVLALLFQWSHGTLLLSGALLGVVFFAAQWLVSRGTWVGSGDIFLVAALGLLLGDWHSTLLMLMIAYISGALTVSFLLLHGRDRTQHIAFGPFLILGTFVVLFFGDTLLTMMMP